MELWSWILTAVGLAGFFLAGKRIWWCWYVNIANQFLWFTYAVLTEQWGFLVGVFAYAIVFTQNAIEWTRDHQNRKRSVSKRMVMDRIDEVSWENGYITVCGHFKLEDEE